MLSMYTGSGKYLPNFRKGRECMGGQRRNARAGLSLLLEVLVPERCGLTRDSRILTTTLQLLRGRSVISLPVGHG